jgi:hypothetical protein
MLCIALRTGECDDGVKQAVAAKLIALAKAGERNPNILCEEVLKDIRRPQQWAASEAARSSVLGEIRQKARDENTEQGTAGSVASAAPPWVSRRQRGAGTPAMLPQVQWLELPSKLCRAWRERQSFASNSAFSTPAVPDHRTACRCI